jgi:hypothetical protein
MNLADTIPIADGPDAHTESDSGVQMSSRESRSRDASSSASQGPRAPDSG